MSDINSWLYPGAAMSANQLNYSLANNGAQLNNMLQNQVLFNQSQPRLGEAAAYYSKLSADYSRASGSSNPYGVFSDTGGPASAAPTATPYQTDSSVWSRGAQPFENMGGGLSGGWGGDFASAPSSGSTVPSPSYDYGSMFGGLAGGLGGTYQGPGTPTIDWNDMYRTASSLGNTTAFDDWSNYINPTRSTADYGGSMFSGLAGGLGGYDQGPNNQIDWSNLFKGPSVDPYPTMPMPGGLGQPMTLPQQQPADYSSLTGRGMGGAGGAQQADVSQYPPAPMPKAPDYGGAMFGGAAGGLGGADQGPGTGISWSKLFGGLFGGGGDTTPAATPQPQTTDQPTVGQRTYDFAPMFDPGAQFGGGGAESQTYGAKSGSIGNQNPFSYIQQGGDEASTKGPSAADMAAQARARLADLIGSPETAAPIEGEPGKSGMTGRTQSDENVTADKIEGEQGRAGMVGRPQAAIDEAPVEGEAGRSGMVNRAAQTPATDLYPGDNPPRPPQSIPGFPATRLARNGQPAEAFVVHHTEGHPTLESVVNDWKTNPRSRGTLGTQYFMDRNGTIHDVQAETGYTGTNQTRTGNRPGMEGYNNSNVVGMEISANNDADVTNAQRQALVQFMNTRYPNTPAYGHNEIDSGKDYGEGFTGARDILQSRAPNFQFDWSNAPIPDPKMTVVDPITGRMGPNPNLTPVAAPTSTYGPQAVTGWESTIPQAQRSPELTAAIQAMAQRYDIPPQSIAAAINMESNFNPRSNMAGNSNYGLAQISRGDFQTAGGRLGGLTFEQYLNATPAQQVAAYSDFINSSPNAVYLNAGAGDPALTSAILQAIHFSPQSQEWANRFAFNNDMATPVTTKPNPALGNTSLDAMQRIYANRLAGGR